MKPVRLALFLIAVLALGLCARRWLATTLRVSGTSMRDTLSGGDIVLVTRFDYLRASPGRGDVVQCRFPGRADTYIKRVIGLPGERISFSGGQLRIDGRPASETYVSSPTEDFEILLGEDEFLVLGDNRAESYDSRMPDMGPIGADGFLGRVRWILWPLSRSGAVESNR